MPGSELFTTIPAEAMLSTFNSILLKNGFTHERAYKCAEVFTSGSIDGVYTHGVNRFARFIEYTQKGFVRPGAVPTIKNKSGSIEQWDGNYGPGPLNADFATDRVMKLAAESTLACVTLSNTNHWMRGGTYGWQAARKGFVFIGFTNTIANMPAWGAIDKKLGNNPLVIAVPYREEAIVLDMAMSQYSFGALELAQMKKEELTSEGGFDQQGNLTKDPSAIISSGRLLPMGLWKGAGLSLLLDILAMLLSGGLATHQITSKEAEYASQVFIAIDAKKLADHPSVAKAIENILADYSSSIPVDSKTRITYPGQKVLETRKHNLQHGIPVLKEVWQAILDL